MWWPFSMTKQQLQRPRPPPTPCYTPTPSDPTLQRMSMTEEDIRVFGWPARGGVITLEHAELVDFDFLELDRLNLTETRFTDQHNEDHFCQRLLFLGAK
jgi:hypothetical protein